MHYSGDTISFEVNLNAKNFSLSAVLLDLSSLSPLRLFSPDESISNPFWQHILFKGIDEDILIKFPDESNLPERAK